MESNHYTDWYFLKIWVLERASPPRYFPVGFAEYTIHFRSFSLKKLVFRRFEASKAENRS